MNRKERRLTNATGKLLMTFVASVVLGFAMMEAATGEEVQMGLFSVTLPVLLRFFMTISSRARRLVTSIVPGLSTCARCSTQKANVSAGSVIRD